MTDFLCPDCGHHPWRFDDGHEDYYLHDDLWHSVWPDGDDGGLPMCIECFEARLGRRLVRDDFTVDAARYLFSRPPSPRFLDRMEQDAPLGMKLGDTVYPVPA